MTASRARGQRRAELAQRLAHRLHTECCTVTALAAGIERRPSTVRQLLAEAGVRSRRVLIGLSDDEVTKELARRFKLGVPVQELQLVTGVDERVIRDRLRHAGVELAKRSRADDLTVPVSKLVEMYEAGATLTDLATLSGGSYGMVRRTLLRRGVQLRARGGR